MSIKVVLADDHAVVRDGIKAIMDSRDNEIEVIGEASNGKQVLQLCETKPADVYLLDIAMPVLSGIDTAERLLKKRPGSKIVVLSMYNDKVLVERALKSGVKGYVLKECAAEEIVRAINEVYRGRYYLSPGVSEYVVEGFLGTGKSPQEYQPEAQLTSRQREILKLICEGYTEKDIASALDVSPYTVHVHKNNIMKKLSIHTKAGLIKYSIKNGIIQV
ncbi:MAG: response regulator [Spirochaetota bacterium]